MIAEQLKKAVLLAAIQGKLTEQITSDGDARDLVREIITVREGQIREGKIKKYFMDSADDQIPFDIPDSWCWAKLGEISSKITDGEHSTPRRVSGYEGFYLLSARNITNNGIRLDDVDYVDESEYARISKRCSPQKGDILISCSGSIGRVSIVEDENKYVMVRSAAMVNQNGLYPKFLMYVLQSPFVQDQIEDKKKQTAQANLFLGAIKEIIIPIPPFAEQGRIVKIVDDTFQEIDILKHEEEKLQRLHKSFPKKMKDSILYYAYKGNLTEQLLEDGDARDLQKEIRKEKTNRIKETKIKMESASQDIAEDEIPFDIPENWCWTRIGECCNLMTGNSISERIKIAKYYGLKYGIPYIGTKDVDYNEKIDYENGVKIPEDEKNFKFIGPKIVLLCIEGGSAGRKIALTDRTVCFGNKLCSFNPFLINPKYLFGYLKSPGFISMFNDGLSGIIGGVSIKKISNILIPLPPLPEQDRIVEQLDKLLPLCGTLE